MNRIIQCITQEHDAGLLAVAVLVCMVGCALSVRVSRRLRGATKQRRRIQLVHSGILCGTTIWSTHFIAMLSYDPGVPHGYSAGFTAVSFGVAVIGTLMANAVYTYGRGIYWAMTGGLVFAGVVAVMHYIGMMAYVVPGQIVWDNGLKLVSLILGGLLGMAAYHRVARPMTRYCWIGGSILMGLSICALHLVGMSAVSIELSPLVVVPEQAISDPVLGMIVFGVTAMILLAGFASLAIQTTLEDEARQRVAHSNSHDPLTGIPNRLWLSRFLEEFDARARSSTAQGPSEKIAVVSIDLDDFKEINDLRGHAAGDEVLVAVVSHLASGCQAGEYIARTGGDEFTAIKTGALSEKDVLRFAKRLRDIIRMPVGHDQFTVTLSGALGVASNLEAAADTADLVRMADVAMARAKASADTQICMYDADMDADSRDKIQLVHDLRRAIPNGELEIVYQLQHELTDLTPIGCEALLRWRHPVRGTVSPAEFIPIAEDTGCIHDIGLWVLRTACAEAARWTQPLSLAVNVAPQQLVQPSFLENLADVLVETQLPPHRLELEVTEASVISDQVFTLEIIKSIKAMGVGISMDDFGTGYSSLATLQSFPFDKIKIDRSFVTDIHVTPQRAAIVRATLLLGNAMDIPVLAEGVEARAELEFLRQEGCNYVQGYYFGTPMSVEKMREVAGFCGQDMLPAKAVVTAA